MGKKAAGLIIGVPLDWRDHPEVEALRAAGHEVIATEIMGADIVLGPYAHYFNEAWLKDSKALKNAVAAAKRRKKKGEA